MSLPQIHILNGPNLNLLGTREPEIYGNTTLSAIEAGCVAHGDTLGVEILFAQTNGEGELITMVQAAGREADGVIINAAGYTHTSVAIHDAVKAISPPVIEVHLSNPFAREPFRHHSFLSPVVDGVICGLGADGYRLALEALASKLQTAGQT